MTSRGTCILCGRENMSLRGRGLCDRDYMRAAREGTLDQYDLIRQEVFSYPYCRCPEGTPVVPLFAGALECGECHRKVFGKHEPIPESVLV